MMLEDTLCRHQKVALEVYTGQMQYSMKGSNHYSQSTHLQQHGMCIAPPYVNLLAYWSNILTS